MHCIQRWFDMIICFDTLKVNQRPTPLAILNRSATNDTIWMTSFLIHKGILNSNLYLPSLGKLTAILRQKIHLRAKAGLRIWKNETIPLAWAQYGAQLLFTSLSLEKQILICWGLLWHALFASLWFLLGFLCVKWNRSTWVNLHHWQNGETYYLSLRHFLIWVSTQCDFNRKYWVLLENVIWNHAEIWSGLEASAHSAFLAMANGFHLAKQSNFSTARAIEQQLRAKTKTTHCEWNWNETRQKLLNSATIQSVLESRKCAQKNKTIISNRSRRVIICQNNKKLRQITQNCWLTIILKHAWACVVRTMEVCYCQIIAKIRYLSDSALSMLWCDVTHMLVKFSGPHKQKYQAHQSGMGNFGLKA